MASSSSSLDDALRYIGKCGRYQVVVSSLITVVGVWLPAWHMMGLIFSADRPNTFHCARWSSWRANGARANGESGFLYAAAGNNSSYTPPNVLTASASANDTKTNITASHAQCSSVFPTEVNGSSSAVAGRIECVEWKYTTLYNESTIVTDFDLVCDRKILAETAQSIFLVGMLVGSVVFGYVSDAFGRKLVLVGACLANGVSGIATALVWSYPGVVALWFLVGMFAQGYNQVQFVMVMEMFPSECRTLAGSLNNLLWGVGIILVTPIAYAGRNWRHMQLAISAPCLVAIPLWLIVDDSVRWLANKGRMEDAQKILNKMARWNCVTPPTGGFVLAQEEADRSSQQGDELDHGNKTIPEVPPPAKKECTYLDVLRSRRMLLNMCIVVFAWFVSIMTYYGASLNSARLAGNKYVNFLFLGLAEIPGYIIIHFTMTWWGRRPSLCLFFTGAGLASIATACLPDRTANGADLTVAIIVAVMSVKLCIVCAYSINMICCTEMLPTAVRNTGFGIGSVFGSVGMATAPFVIYLDQFASYLPFSIFGGLCILSGLLAILLPETRNKPLPETLEDAENIGKKPPTTPKPDTREQMAAYRRSYVRTATEDDAMGEDAV